MVTIIQPYKRKKDGQKAWITLKEQHTGQHAGLYKWLAKIKKEEISYKQKIYTGKTSVDTL